MKNLSRRKFIQTGLMGAAGLSMFPLLKGCGPVAPSDQIRFGFIGLGRQALSLTNGFYENPSIKVVAAADVYGRKRERYEMIVRNHQEEAGQSVDITTTENYHELLERDDIDVIVVSTPDHWHAIQAIEACQAGKDIYLEKPVTLTVKEGIEVIKAVRENDIILGVGSQQRSDPNFQHAINLVRENRLGDLVSINAWVGGPAVPYDLPKEEVPQDLNWDKWLGPNQSDVHYNPQLNPPITLDPVQNEQFWGGWRWYRPTGGGLLTDWGAHMFDIAQLALNKQNSGPVEVIPAGHGDSEYIDYVYEGGLVMTNAPFREDEMQGCRFEGSDAWIEVHRGVFNASDDSLLPTVPEESEVEEYETASPHLVNFIDAVRSRRDPIAPIEEGHRTATIGTIGNIATVLDRPLKWNPESESFVDDAEADTHLHREYRDGYSL